MAYDFGMGGIGYGDAFTGESAVGGGPLGLNPSNLLRNIGLPGPQNVSGLYQPGGMLYGASSFMLPYNPGDVRDKVGQSMAAPSMSQALQQMPGNTGVAHNSPARVYLAAMRAGSQRGQNASTRALLPLQYGGQNAQSLLSQQIGLQDYDLNLEAQSQAQSQSGLGLVMQLLSPFLNSVLSGGAGA